MDGGDLAADQRRRHPLLAYTVAVALGGSGFIAAFTAGIVFGALAGERAEHSTFLAEQSGELLNAITFLLFGAVLLGPALGELDWRVALYAVGSLTVVRMLLSQAHHWPVRPPGRRVPWSRKGRAGYRARRAAAGHRRRQPRAAAW